jgi:hypothetical protein
MIALLSETVEGKCRSRAWDYADLAIPASKRGQRFQLDVGIIRRSA